MVLFWGELWVLQKGWGMVLVGETVSTTVEEYGVTSEGLVGTTAGWKGMVLGGGGTTTLSRHPYILCHLATTYTNKLCVYL